MYSNEMYLNFAVLLPSSSLLLLRYIFFHPAQKLSQESDEFSIPAQQAAG